MRIRKPVEIEHLLRWSCDELAKRQTSSAEGIWEHIADNAQHGGIDPGHGAAQRYAHHGLPHPDALRIESAVEGMASTTIDWDISGPDIMGDMLDLFKAHRDTVAWLPTSRYDTAVLVRQHAIMGDRPRWYEDLPLPMRILNERGPRVAKVIGDWSDGRWKAGARCPLRWVTSPISIAVRRGAYAVWHDGLRRLVAALDLEEHQATPPAAMARPWLAPERIHAVWHGAPAGRTTALPLKPARGAPAARKKLRLGGAVPQGGVP